MGRSIGITLAKCQFVLRVLISGMTGREVAAHFNSSNSRISCIWTRFYATGSVIDKPCSGRPRKMTTKEYLFIVIT